MLEKRNGYKILVGKSVRKRLFGNLDVIKGQYLVKNTTDIRIDVIFYD